MKRSMLNKLKNIFIKLTTVTTGQSSGKSGFTLVEVLVALAIFSVIGVAFISALFASTRASGIVDEKTNARALITEHIEVIRLLPYAATYPSAGDNIAIPDQYSVVIETEGTDDDITWQPSTGNETLQRIFVSVFREDRLVMKICTFRTPRLRQ